MFQIIETICFVLVVLQILTTIILSAGFYIKSRKEEKREVHTFCMITSRSCIYSREEAEKQNIKCVDCPEFLRYGKKEEKEE